MPNTATPVLLIPGVSGEVRRRAIQRSLDAVAGPLIGTGCATFCRRTTLRSERQVRER
jgi:hypothetical protein